MKYLSVCSGIEAATVAWHPLGWQAVGFSDIEPFPLKVLAHHYPEVPQLGSMTDYEQWNIEQPNLLVGGTPCQSFSVAGLRKGLDDERGNLMLTYLKIADKFRPRWLVWENVPGVLSSNGGRDFGALLGGLAELGYGFAYRVLDAQYFGVAQRRRRVFVVGYLGDWRRAAAVLFERDSLCGNPAPSRKAREEVAATLSTGFGSRGVDSDQIANGNYALQSWPASVAPTLNASFESKQGLEDQHIRGGRDCSFQVAKCLITKTCMDAETETLIPTTGGHFSYGIQSTIIGRKPENGPQGTGISEDVSFTLTKTDQHGVAQPISESGYVASTLRTGGNDHADIYNSVAINMAVRRLTPVECERLQGFPDGYTDIKPNGKPTPDGPRYKALGNSMAVPVMAWIGKRIAEVDNAS